MPASDPLSCPICSRLQQPQADTDWYALARHVQTADAFELFGLPRDFDLDPSELRARFLSISRNIHPDILTAHDSQLQPAALQLSSDINRAYERLRDPIQRAGYILEISGGKTAAEDKRVPQEILNQSLMLREEIEEARAAGDTAVLDAIRESVAAQRTALETRIAELGRNLIREPGDALRDELRLQLNAIKYVVNLLAQL